eukprot:SAG11_NODE_25072_length_364_cov_0.671698_1_plen_29_part_10
MSYLHTLACDHHGMQYFYEPIIRRATQNN